nr:vesicular, overexpressed in cancer, prosurvival protein 1 [Vicugna pacos]
MGRLARRVAALLLGLLVECTEAKKHCWYFEGLYPTYYICRPFEDCCGSRCCVRALSIQRLWYFWQPCLSQQPPELLAGVTCRGRGASAALGDPHTRRRLLADLPVPRVSWLQVLRSPLLVRLPRSRPRCPGVSLGCGLTPATPDPGEAPSPGTVVLPSSLHPFARDLRPGAHRGWGPRPRTHVSQGRTRGGGPPGRPLAVTGGDGLGLCRCAHVCLLACLSGAQQLGLPYYTDPGGPGVNPAGNPAAMAFQVQPSSPQGSSAYPPPPSYCNTPPPPYEQVVKDK